MSLYRLLEWNEDITLYHKVEEKVEGKTQVTWERAVYNKCFWTHKVTRSIDGLAVNSNSNYICRIPCKINEISAISEGDIAVLGIVEDEPIGSGAEIKKKYAPSCFTVSKVTDNSKLKNTAHWYVSDF